MAAQPTTPPRLRIGIVTPRAALTAAQKSSLLGVRLGAREAKQTAELFGGDVQIYEANSDGGQRGALRAAGFLSSARKVQILIALSDADVDSVSQFAESKNLIFLNTVTRSAASRSACRRRSFHIEASNTMYENASRLFRRPRPGAALTAASAAMDSVVLWDSHLERFGASQLNDRYRAAAKADMDGRAWAGWAAVKFVAESALRAGSADPNRILAYLEAPTTQFDGHKGWPLSFRTADHQLRQPLYIVVPGRRPSASVPRVVDIPDLRSVASAPVDRSAANALDRLSAGSRISCAWSDR